MHGISCGHADIFERNEEHATDGALDLNVTTAQNEFAYQAKTGIPGRSSSRIDFDQNITTQIKEMFRGMNMLGLINDVNGSSLMFYQYSSPAAADLLKHYHTIAHLRLGMMYQDLRNTESNLGGDLNNLQDEVKLNCIQDKLNAGSHQGDLVAIMDSCQIKLGTGIFSRLGGNDNVFRRALDLIHVRGSDREKIIDILPAWNVLDNGHHVLAPHQRIGAVYAKNKKELLQSWQEAVEEYLTQREVNIQTTQLLSQPGFPVDEQTVRDLAAIENKQRQTIIHALASQMAYCKTIEDYAFAKDRLNRAMFYPGLEQSYKQIIAKGIAFLDEETESLDRQYRYVVNAKPMVKAFEEAVGEQKAQTIEHINNVKDGKDLIDQMRFMTQGL